MQGKSKAASRRSRRTLKFLVQPLLACLPPCLHPYSSYASNAPFFACSSTYFWKSPIL